MFLSSLSENIGSSASQASTSYGGNAQLGGSRNTFEAPVDQSQNKIEIGQNAKIEQVDQLGGTRNIRE